jgi:hypothetical protein
MTAPKASKAETKKIQSAILAGITLIASLTPIAESHAQSESTPITGIEFDTQNVNRLSNGTDIWPVTWAADNNLYTAGGDGEGCDGVDTRGLDINRLSGGPGAPLTEQCSEIYSEAGYLPKGIVAANGNLYLLKQEREDQNGDGLSFAAAKFCESKDQGVSWTCSGWTYEGEMSLPQGMLINFGQDNAGSPGGHIYMLGMENSSSGRFDALTLARVLPQDFIDASRHEFLVRVQEDGSPIWSTDYRSRQPIHSNADSIHWGATMSFNPVLQRFLLCYFTDTNANLNCYDGPRMWGPWTLVHSQTLADSSEKFSVFFVNKNDGSNDWISDDGLTWHLLISGLDSWDSLNIIKATLQTSVPKRPAPPTDLKSN